MKNAETKQQHHKFMAQHRRSGSSAEDSAVNLHTKDKGHSFEDSNVHILDRGRQVVRTWH